ncbi:UNVERIFIED_CONTAM: hypothetical protein FKN15_001340 [Acipenser sinensis]
MWLSIALKNAISEKSPEIEGLAQSAKNLHVFQTVLQNSRQKNLALALEYRDLQKTFLEIKSRLVCSYDEKVRKGASLQDHQQVQILMIFFVLLRLNHHFPILD